MKVEGEVMKQNSLVSIIIPVYNSEKYIKKCLDSIINQTYKNLEVITINDGSTDDSLKILESYKKKFTVVKVYSQENSGIAKTRNKGIELASGKYLMFIDNDDFIDEKYVETFVKTIELQQADIVVGGYKRVDSKNKIIFHNKPKNNDWSKYTIIAPWAKIYKKSIIKKVGALFLDYGIGEDVYFNLNLYSKGLKIVTIDYEGYNWFFNDLSVSNTTHKGLKAEIDLTYLLNKIIAFNKNNKESDFFNYFIYRLCLYYLLESGRYSEKKVFNKEYLKLNDWLKSNIKDKIKIPTEENLKIKICMILFKFMQKLKLIRLFSFIYCKG